MLFALYITIFFLCLWKIRLPHNSGDGYEFLSKPRTESIKGIFILLIVISHANGYIKDAGYDYAQLGDQWFLLIIDKLKQLVVVMFLFYSGYGVGLSIHNKGKSYVKSIPRRRILTTILNMDVAVLVFIALNLVLGIDMTFSQCGWSLIGWDSVGNSNWYIFCIVLCYAFSYVATYFTSKKYLQCAILFIMTAVVIVMLYRVKDHWWYDTLMAYPLGYAFSCYRDSVIRWIRQHYCTSLLTAVITFTCLSMWHHEYLGFRFNAISMAFAMIVLLLTMKVQVHNPVLEWCGKHLFPIYMYMRLPMIVIQQTKPETLTNNPSLFIIASLVITTIIATLYKHWQIKLL